MPVVGGWFSVVAMLGLGLTTSSCDGGRPWSQEDTRAVETTLEDYRRAWLDNDTTRIMKAVSDNVVLFVPGATAANVVGKPNLRSFWFPSTDTLFLIRTYEITDQEVHGDGVYAIVQGKSLLSWDTVANDSVLSSSTSRSEYLSILRKEDGHWKIFRQMYVIRR